MRSALILAAAFATSSADYPRALIYDGMPPPRLRAPQAMFVSTGTLDECGTPTPGYVFEACVRGGIVHLPNPCDYPEQKFAVLMCHEQAHLAGWPADHGA